MPVLAVPANAAIVAGFLASSACIGISNAQVALGVATGLATYAGGGLVLVSVDVGTLGAGVGTGPGLILPPPAIIGPMIASFAGAVILGIFSAPVATAIGTALSTVLATGIITTVSAGVGVGTGVVKAIPNPGVSVPAFIAGFKAAGLLGIASITMATAVAAGLDIGLAAATGAVVITGPASPLPGSGAGVGKII